MKLKFVILFVIFLFPSLVLADVNVEIDQSGADSGDVTAEMPFTVTASGWEGDCNSATIDLSECSVCSISESTTKSISGDSVSWTTLTASVANSQKITVSVSGMCTPDSGYITFDSKTAPSLSASVDPSSVSVTRGSTFTISLNLQNNGETTARFGSITLSPSYFTISSGCSPSDIIGGQSLGLTCKISTSSSTPIGTQTMSILISPSNGNSVTKTVDVTVSSTSTTSASSGGAGGATGGVGSAGGGGGSTSEISKLFGIVSTNAPINWNVSRTEISFTNLFVEVEGTFTNVRLTLSSLPSKPSSIVQKPTSNVYQYLELKTQNLSDTNIKSVKLNFRVNKTWVSANNINLNSISLYRYSNIWQKLQTSLINEDENYYYFNSVSPGLSVFAIAGEKNVMTTTQIKAVTTTSPTIMTTTIIPEVKPYSNFINLYIILGVIVFLALILMIFFFRKFNKKEINETKPAT